MKVLYRARFGSFRAPARLAVAFVALLSTAVAQGQGYLLWSASGSFGGDLLGAAVAACGDIDGDSIADLLVGAPGFAPAGLTAAGEAKVFSGANGTLVLSRDGAGSAQQFGASVDEAGDLNGDGVADLLVGAPGQAHAFSGATGSPLFTFSGSMTGDRFGSSVADAGDLDGDGRSEILVGAPQVGPFLTGPGYVRLFSGASGLPMATIVGDRVGDSFGASVDGLGDIDGDGFADLVVGAPRADLGGSIDIGEVKVISLVGIPVGANSFGSGCAGSTGVVPVLQTSGGNPDASAGNPNFLIVLSNAVPTAPTFLIVGVSNTFWAAPAIPLPASLAAVGFPACSLAVSAEFLLPTSTSSSGSQFVPMPVPANTALVGQSVYFQWFVLDPPGAMTRGLEVVL